MPDFKQDRNLKVLGTPVAKEWKTTTKTTTF